MGVLLYKFGLMLLFPIRRLKPEIFHYLIKLTKTGLRVLVMGTGTTIQLKKKALASPVHLKNQAFAAKTGRTVGFRKKSGIKNILITNRNLADS